MKVVPYRDQAVPFETEASAINAAVIFQTANPSAVYSLRYYRNEGWYVLITDQGWLHEETPF